jgi:hypothetical protein
MKSQMREGGKEEQRRERDGGEREKKRERERERELPVHVFKHY